MEKVGKTQKLKQYFEELNLQLHLGANDVKDELEVYKKKLKTWTNENLDDLKKEGKEGNEKLKTTLEELRLQAALGKAETKEEFSKQKATIANLLNKLDDTANKAEKEGEAFWDESKDFIKHSAQVFATKLEVLSYELTLKSVEAEKDWKSFKDELKGKTKEWQDEINEETTELKSKLNDFKSDLSERLNHLKKAFGPK